MLGTTTMSCTSISAQTRGTLRSRQRRKHSTIKNARQSPLHARQIPHDSKLVMSPLLNEDLNLQLQHWRGGNASPEGTMPVAPYIRTTHHCLWTALVLAFTSPLSFVDPTQRLMSAKAKAQRRQVLLRRLMITGVRGGMKVDLEYKRRSLMCESSLKGSFELDMEGPPTLFFLLFILLSFLSSSLFHLR